MFSCSKKLSKVLCSFDTHFLFKYDLFVEYILGGTNPLSLACARQLSQRESHWRAGFGSTDRAGSSCRKAAGPVLIGSSICIAAVNLDSGAQPFPIAKTSLVQHSRYRLASGSPTRGAGAKRLRGCAISHVSVPYPGCWKAILRTTSQSPSVTPLLVGEALAVHATSPVSPEALLQGELSSVSETERLYKGTLKK